MQKIKLKGGGEVLIDDEDLSLVNQFTWTTVKTGNNPYVRGWVNGSQVLIHRLIMGAPKGAVVDHINHDPFDNRRSNLRICTTQQNVAHQRKLRKSRSQFKGVYPRANGRFQAVICVRYKLIALGTFSSEIEAAQAYDAAAKRYHGGYAFPNFQGATP